MQKLPFAVVSKNPSGTSKEAAASFEDGAETLREQVFEAIAARGSLGYTCDELEELFDGSHQTISPRVWELHKTGRIVRSCQQRLTRSKRLADVMVIAATPSSVEESAVGQDLLAFRAYEKALRATVARLRELRTAAPATNDATGRALGWLLQFEKEPPTLEQRVRGADGD